MNLKSYATCFEIKNETNEYLIAKKYISMLYGIKQVELLGKPDETKFDINSAHHMKVQSSSIYYAL